VKPDIFDTPILFSPDSARVAVVEDNRIHILEIPSGHSIVVLTAPGVRNLESMVFSGDRKRLAASHDKGVTVWNVESGAEIMSSDGRIDRNALALNGNGNLLAVGHDGIELWDLQKTAIVRKIQLGEREHAESLIFADNDQRIVADIATALPVKQARHGILQFKYHFVVWSVASGAKRKSFAGANQDLQFPLTFVAPRMLITVDYGDYLRLWDLESGELTETWETPSGHPSADGKLFLRDGGAPGRLELLEIGDSDESARAFEYRSPLCAERTAVEIGAKKVDFQDFGILADGWNDEREHTGWSSSVAPDCTPVGFSHTEFKSAERAKNELNRQAGLATEVLEKGPPKDFWQQAFLGERVVARFANRHSQSDTMVVMWVEDNVFYRISSSSLTLGLAMERQRLQAILKK
jgi:WD40 repeat protein